MGEADETWEAERADSGGQWYLLEISTKTTGYRVLGILRTAGVINQTAGVRRSRVRLVCCSLGIRVRPTGTTRWYLVFLDNSRAGDR